MVEKTNIFVCGHRKSGTTLLVNLLDGHSELSVCPFDLTIFYAFFPNEDRFTQDEKAKRLKNVIFDNWAKEMSADNFININEMQQIFFNLCANKFDIKTVYHALMKSFENVSNQTERKVRVTKETSLELHANKISEMIPNAKFIHVVRNPLDNFASLYSGLKGYYSKFDDNYFSLLHSLLDRVSLGLKCGIQNQFILGSDKYMFLKYEDLVQDPQNMLLEVLQFIDAPIEPVCFKPSVIGHETPGNSFVELKQYEISKGRIGTYKKTLNSDVVGFINLMLSEMMDKFSYETEKDIDKNVLDFASKYYDYINKKNHFFDRFVEYGH